VSSEAVRMKMNFTSDDLLRCYSNPQIANVPDIDPWEAEAYAEPLKRALIKHGATNRRRVAHYLAQAGYESGCFNWLEEWGGAQMWYAPFWGRGAIMLTHRQNYAAIGQLVGADLEANPTIIGCKGDDPTEWPRNTAKCMEVGPAYFRWRQLWQFADRGDAGFEPIMFRVLGAVEHPSYWDRWALYRAMIAKLPRPLFESSEES
jgi:predicted chitinase